MTRYNRLGRTMLGLAAIVAPLALHASAAAAQSAPATDQRATIEKVNRGLVTIVTGRSDSTSARMATELADVVDDGATRRLLPVIGKGAAQSVVDLRLLRGIDLAVLQLDVVADLRERNAFTVVSPLHREELHVLAGSVVRSFEELDGRKINVEPTGSGTAVTVRNVLQALGVRAELTSFTHAVAVEKLKGGEIAALALVTGKPAAPLSARALPPGAHFLAVPLTAELAKTYARATLTGADYPELVGQEPVETIAVQTMLAAANLQPDTERYRNAAALVEALFTNFAELQQPGRHPKWKEVDIRTELPGWRRFGPAEAWLKRNPAAPQVASTDMKQIFVKFLDERSKASGTALTAERKEELFQQFQRWQQQRPR